MTSAEKIAQAVRTEKIFPAGVRKVDCRLSHTRPVWRLENGQAVLVAYEIYRGPRNQYGKIPGVFGRSEFGAEITLAIAYQVYIVGLSFDKVCLLSKRPELGIGRGRGRREGMTSANGPLPPDWHGPAGLGHGAIASRRRPFPGPRCDLGAPIGDAPVPNDRARDRQGTASRVQGRQDGFAGHRQVSQHIVQVVIDHQMMTMRTADDAIQLQATGSRSGMSKE